MNQQNLVTGLVISSSLIVAFLLAQSDVVLPPIAKVILGALNVSLTYWSRVSNGGGQVTSTTTTTTEPPKD